MKLRTQWFSFWILGYCFKVLSHLVSLLVCDMIQYHFFYIFSVSGTLMFYHKEFSCQSFFLHSTQYSVELFYLHRYVSFQHLERGVQEAYQVIHSFIHELELFPLYYIPFLTLILLCSSELKFSSPLRLCQTDICFFPLLQSLQYVLSYIETPKSSGTFLKCVTPHPPALHPLVVNPPSWIREPSLRVLKGFGIVCIFYKFYSPLFHPLGVNDSTL